MIPDLSPIFNRYERLRAEADAVFASVAGKFPDRVACKRGCSDCCHAVFDLSLVEAMYLNAAFGRAFGYGPERSRIVTIASGVDRKLTRLKRALYRAEKDGEDSAAIMKRAAAIRIPCPLLSEDGGSCVLYEARPITCRLYGIPTVIAGQGHVCGFSKFSRGEKYPVVRLEKIQARLEALSQDIADAVRSRFKELAQVYMPLSMALLTRYDESWLGIGPAKPEE